MLTQAENEMLTRLGPGTPCGELMRRYWHPIAATAQLADKPVRKVGILGEDLVLFRDRSEHLGLIGPRCPHRAMHMEFGIPEEVGLRCPYHGWLFDGMGRCLEQPLAPPNSTFKDRVRTTAIYLHGRLFQYALEQQGRLTDDPHGRYNATIGIRSRTSPGRLLWRGGRRPPSRPRPGLTSRGGRVPAVTGSISTKSPKAGGSVSRTTWTATAQTGTSSSHSTRRPTG